MKELKGMIHDLINYRDKNGFLQLGLVEDLSTYTAIKIKTKYMILPASVKNIEFSENLKNLYPNIVMFDEYKDGIRDDSHAVQLSSYLKKILHSKAIEFDEAFKRITDKVIIIKKTEEVNEHMEAMKIGNILTGDKKFVVKEISFFSGKRPSGTYHHGGFSDEFKAKFRYLYKDVKVKYTSINTDFTFDLGIRMQKELESDFNKEVLEKVNNIKEYKKILKQEAIKYLQNNFMYGQQPVDINDLDVYLPLKEFKSIGYIKSNVKYYVGFNNTYFKSKTRELHFDARVKNIPFEELERLVDTMIFRKNKIKELLAK